MNEGEAKALAAIKEYRVQLSRVGLEIASLDGELQPLWDVENRLKAAVAATHKFPPGKPIRFDWARKDERRELFKAMLDNLVGYGPTREAQRKLKADYRYYEREIKRLEYDIAAAQRKQQRELL